MTMVMGHMTIMVGHMAMMIRSVRNFVKVLPSNVGKEFEEIVKVVVLGLPDQKDWSIWSWEVAPEVIMISP